MLKPTTQSENRRCTRGFSHMRWMLSFVLAFAVFIGQSTPFMAQHGGIWVEICGDGSSYFIQLEQEDKIPANDCDHCSSCLVASSSFQGLNAVNLGAFARLKFTTTNFLTVRERLPEGPEHYWAANRGPPITKVTNIMTTFTSILFIEPVEMALLPWGEPWV